MKVIKAPEVYTATADEVKVFVAGGLQKCDWQYEFFDELRQDYINTKDVVMYNPRRDDFDVSNPAMEVEQITWEFNQLTGLASDPKYIFSMYFDNSESPQPICFYELGRYLTMVKPENCIITVHPEFFRRNDVIIQTSLATNNRVPVVLGLPYRHARRVAQRFTELREGKVEHIF